MSETVYIETSILGYLTARPTNHLVLAANTKVTRDWWEPCRSEFTLYASELVQDEATQGDGEIANQRLSLLDPIAFLELTEAAITLGQAFLQQSSLPTKAANDALHMALATVYGIDYLLTWNCKHMANAQIQKKLAQIAEQSDYELPIICTPYELMGYTPE